MAWLAEAVWLTNPAVLLRHLVHLQDGLIDLLDTAGLLARPRRFNRRVQRQQVGLESDFIDDANNIGDLAAALMNRVHRRYGALPDLPTLLGLWVRAAPAS